MYSEEDINSAVAAGALSAEAAAGLRAHVAKVHDMPRSDEENFRLVTSFNDIFVTIGVVIMLIAVGSIGASLGGNGNAETFFGGLWNVLLPGTLVAVTAWYLAEVFTRRRRMALPSIVLLVAFLGAVFAMTLCLVALPIGLALGVNSLSGNEFESSGIGEALGAVIVAIVFLGGGALTAFAAHLHWKRFMVPVTIAAGTAAVVGSVIGAIAMAFQVATDGSGTFPIMIVTLMAGLAVFAFAMRWDMSDRARTTRRSDVAFWLHLLAAPMIAHPLFHWLGVTDGGDIGVAAAAGVLLVYVVMGIVALAIDRRAMLVSALAYVLIALTFLFDKFGAVELNFALTALVIGSALLTLSAFWTPIRQKVVSALPDDLQQRLPETGALPTSA